MSSEKSKYGGMAGALQAAAYAIDGPIEIPPIPCSFAWHQHPQHLQMKDMCDAWIVARFGNLPCARGAFNPDLLVRSGFALLATLSYASGITDRVSHIVKFYAWFFMCDNVLDDPDQMGCDLAAADQLSQAILHVLIHGATSCSPDEDSHQDAAALLDTANDTSLSTNNTMVIDVLANTTLDWWGPIKTDMPPNQQVRFINMFTDYLASSQEQIHYRCAGTFPDVEKFKLIRADTGGWQVCNVLIEYSLGLNFDNEALSHPLLQDLSSMVSSNICCVNELLSFEKEYMEGDLMNLVHVLHLHKLHQFKTCNVPTSASPLSMQATMLEIWDLIKTTDEECTRLMEEIRACTMLMGKHGMESYLHGVADILGGNVYWHLVSERYGIRASDSMHATRPDFSMKLHLHLPLMIGNI